MMRYIVALSAFMVASCASVRLYPVCFYNGSQPMGAARDSFFEGMTGMLRGSLGLDLQRPITVSPDGRWLIANATRFQNAAAAHVWPRIGCIGSAVDSNQIHQEAGCVAYVRQFIKDENYFAFGNAKDAGGIDIYNESPDPKYDVHCVAAVPAP